MKFAKFSKMMVSIALVILSAVIFCACSPVTLQTKYHENGAIEVELILPTGEMRDLGISQYYSRVNNTYRITQHYLDDLKNAYEDKIIELFSNAYDFPSGYSRVEKLSYISINNPRYTFEINISPGMTEYNYSNDAETIEVSGTFASIYAYILYFYPDAFIYDEESENIKLDNEIFSTLIDVPVNNSTLEETTQFLTHTFTQTATPFGYNGGECKLLSPLTLGLKTYTAGTTIVEVAKDALSLTDEEESYVFSFLTPYRRVDSNGTLSQSGLYYVHTWTFEDTQGQIKLYRHYANDYVWYALAFGIGILFFGGGLAIAMVVHKHRKDKGMTYLQKISDFMADESNVKGESDVQKEKED